MRIIPVCVFGQALQQRPLEGLVARLRDQKLQQQVTDAVDQMPAHYHTNRVNDRLTAVIILIIWKLLNRADVLYLLFCMMYGAVRDLMEGRKLGS